MAIFSSDGYFKHTPIWVKKVLLAVKGVMGTIAVSSFVSGHERVAFFVMLAGAVIDELAKFIKEPDQTKWKYALMDSRPFKMKGGNGYIKPLALHL